MTGMLYHICGYNPCPGMGSAGFLVKLYPAWKLAVADHSGLLNQANVNCAIENMGCEWLDNHGYGRTFEDDGVKYRVWEPRTSIRVAWGEWGPEHISVPGNACGLDIFGSIHTPRGGACLLPHNVDSIQQASLLLTVFLFFADTLVLHLESKG